MLLLSAINSAYNYLLLYKLTVILFSISFVFLYNKQSYFFNKHLTPFVFIIIIIMITFRPEVWQYFGDTCNYAMSFRFAQQYGEAPDKYKDIGFVATINFFKKFDLRIWFLFFALLYVIPQYLVCKKLFKEYRAFACVLLVGALSFFAYGFNGMRNGTACSLVMLGFIVPFPLKVLLFIFAVSLHKSTLLPIVAYFISLSYNNTKRYIYLWCVCLFVAYSFSGILGDMQWLTDLIGDSRVNYINQDFSSIENASNMNFTYTGFRWDFLIYSAVPIFLGWKTLIVERIKNDYYCLFLNIYLLCNAAWLFTARIPFNNRFAYLSWFILPIVLAYPFVLNTSLKTSKNMNNLVVVYLILGLLFY